MKKCIKNFTLLEAIVIVVIVALFLTVAPVLVSRAAELSKLDICSNQLKQINTYISLYREDNNDFCPVQIGNSQTWYGNLYVYNMPLFSKKQFCGGSAASNPACPAMDGENGTPVIQGKVDYANNPMVGGYAMNMWTGTNNLMNRWTYRKYDSFKNPAAKILMADGKFFYGVVDRNASVDHWNGNLGDAPCFSFRHEDKLNTLYFDGHIAALNRQPGTDAMFNPDL